VDSNRIQKQIYRINRTSFEEPRMHTVHNDRVGSKSDHIFGCSLLDTLQENTVEILNILRLNHSVTLQCVGSELQDCVDFMRIRKHDDSPRSHSKAKNIHQILKY
jgi:hypothetical protein